MKRLLALGDDRPELVALLLIAGITAFVALVYADTFVAMARNWEFSSYRHCIVVFPVSAYLLWRLRGSLARAQLRPWPWGLAILIGLVALWLVSRAVGIQVAEQLAMVLMIPVAVTTFLGLDLARRSLFPLAFLAVAVPFGDSLVPYLMRITADVSAALLRMVGVPVFRDGQFLTLPGGEFEIADVCSGLNYLVSGTTIALLFAYLTYRSAWKRATFVVATALGLVVANGVRAFVVMFVASATDMRVFAGADHVLFGWLLFGVAIGTVFWIGGRYADRPEVAGRSAASAAASGERSTVRLLPLVLVLGLVMLAVTAQPFRRDPSAIWLLLPVGGALLLWVIAKVFSAPATSMELARNTPRIATVYGGMSAAVVASVGAGVLAAGPLLLNRAPAHDSSEVAAVELPGISGCGAPTAWLASWEPRLQSPDLFAAGSYRCADHTVNVLFAGYLNDSQGNELVGDQNRLMPDDGRRFGKRGRFRFEAADGRSIGVNEIRVDGRGASSLIWYWYAVGERTATTPEVVKLLQAVHVVLRGQSDGALYFLETTAGASLEDARDRLAAIARAIEAGLGHGRIAQSTERGESWTPGR